MTQDLEQKYGTDGKRSQLAFSTEDPDILTDLSTDSIIGVRLEVAGNENTPSAILAHLATDTEVSVRVQVAGNINADAATIKLLLNDPNKVVREEASYSEHTDT